MIYTDPKSGQKDNRDFKMFNSGFTMDLEEEMKKD